MYGRRPFFGFGLFAFVGISALVAAHFGFLDHTAGREAIFYGGLGLGLAAIGALTLGLGIFRDHGLAAWRERANTYVVLTLAITATVGLVFRTLISASLFASGVGFLALLGIVALYGITFMGGFGGTTGHCAQWRQGIGAAA